MIKLSNVSKIYQDGTNALKNIDLEIYTGKIVIILGENGAGKTTLLKIISNLLHPTTGVRDVDHHQPIGYLGQNFSESLYNYLTVKENLEYFVGLNDIKLTKSRIKQELAYYNLADIVDNRVFKLSGGQKQIVTFVRTFLHDPDLVILDEPFANIDPERVSQMCGYIKDYSLKNEALILISSHTLENIEVIFDEIIFLQNDNLLRIPRDQLLEYLKKYRIIHYFVPSEEHEDFEQIIQEKKAIYHSKSGQYSYNVMYNSSQEVELNSKFKVVSSKKPTLNDLSFLLKGDYDTLVEMVN